MIFGAVSSLGDYSALHPEYAAVVEFIREKDWPRTPLGRHELPGLQSFFILAREAAAEKMPRLESHRRYIDLQIALTGDFSIGWCAHSDNLEVEEKYDEERDIMFWRGAPRFFLPVAAGEFALLFPNDLHAPLPPKTNECLKVVFKIPVLSN